MATINHKTYNEGTETFKDFSVYDGKDTLIFKVDGSAQSAAVTGTLSVSGNAAFDTNVLFVDATNNRVGIGTSSPANTLDVGGEIKLSSDLYMGNDRFLRFVRNSGSTSIQTLGIPTGTDDVRLLTTGDFNVVTGGLSSLLTVKASGNVGIGTSAPEAKLDIKGEAAAGSVGMFIENAAASTTSNSADIYFGTWGGSTVAGITNARISAVNTLGVDARTDLDFYTYDGAASGKRVSITSGGVLSLTQGQIKFPVTQVASADPNTLDDYEEGEWTIGISFGGASVGVTTLYNTGTYTKIGRQVTVNGRLSLTSKGSSTGNAAITGLPFTQINNESYRTTPCLRFANISFANAFQGLAALGTTTINLEEITEAGADGDLTNADFVNTSDIIISYTYFV